MKYFIVFILFLFNHNNVNARPAELTNFEETPENGDYFEGDMIGVELDYSKGAAQLITGSKTQWSNGIIPYKITEGEYNETELNKIYEGMRLLENQTKIGDRYCVRLVPYTNEPNWVRIYSGSGCSSHVGKSSTLGEQLLSLKKPTAESTSTCLVAGTIAHEFIHALGLHHEQSRPDRDDWIDIKFENITPGKEHNFNKYTTTIDTLGLPYDYDSIMHYSQTSFSVNGAQTIMPKVFGVTIGQRKQLSSIDVAEIRKYYNCS